MSAERIAAGVRTVVNIAEHFERLKQNGLEMLKSFGVRERGYFSPSEDEELRHLLISYWQPRNALIELVVSFHDDQSTAAEWRRAAFLVAYSGALVLVDAARFLRTQCEKRPVLRAKLNEPEPHFGIPQGTYDRVQKSLTSPVHIWHLYHASEYFRTAEANLRQTAREFQIEAIFEIIDRHQSQLEVGIAEYTSARLKVRSRQMRAAIGRDLLKKALYGLQKTVSRFLADTYTKIGHRPQLPPQIQNQIRDLLQPGDVIINRKDHAITNYFLPGYWPHAAFYLGSHEQLQEWGIAKHPNAKTRWKRLMECDVHEPCRVLEAKKDGVWIRSMDSPFAADAIAVIRPLLNQAEIAEAITRGLFHDGKGYDFDFDFSRSDRLVCTEVIYRSFDGVGGVSFELTRRAGRMTLAAEDLIRMALDRNYFEPAFVYTPSYVLDLVTDKAAETVMRATLEA